MESEVSLLSSLKSTIGPYSETPNPVHRFISPLSIYKIHFHINLFYLLACISCAIFHWGYTVRILFLILPLYVTFNNPYAIRWTTDISHTWLFKKKYTLSKIILQVLLNIWRCAIYRLKGKFSKLFSHLTSTRCEPHVCRGRCQIDNPALPTLVTACHR
jgi:hypothetical protein